MELTLAILSALILFGVLNSLTNGTVRAVAAAIELKRELDPKRLQAEKAAASARLRRSRETILHHYPNYGPTLERMESNDILEMADHLSPVEH